MKILSIGLLAVLCLVLALWLRACDRAGALDGELRQLRARVGSAGVRERELAERLTRARAATDGLRASIAGLSNEVQQRTAELAREIETHDPLRDQLRALTEEQLRGAEQLRQLREQVRDLREGLEEQRTRAETEAREKEAALTRLRAAEKVARERDALQGRLAEERAASAARITKLSGELERLRQDLERAGAQAPQSAAPAGERPAEAAP